MLMSANISYMSEDSKYLHNYNLNYLSSYTSLKDVILRYSKCNEKFLEKTDKDEDNKFKEFFENVVVIFEDNPYFVKQVC